MPPSETKPVTYAKEFFDLQLRFAERVTALSGLPLARVLFEYTNFYIRFGLGRPFDSANPAWQEYVNGLPYTHDVGEWTYRFYRRRPDAMAAPGVVATFGCFAYAQPTGERIRLHFHNAEAEGRSPLAGERIGRRRAELAALFAHVRRSQPPGLRVVGASWLYNLEAYRRLFPPSYLATARVSGHRFQHMPMWGQFLDRHGAIKTDMARDFLLRLAHEPSVDRLGQCFPFQVLWVDAPVQEFFEFHRI